MQLDIFNKSDVFQVKHLSRLYYGLVHKLVLTYVCCTLCVLENFSLH
jgi:hypothetical protein